MREARPELVARPTITSWRPPGEAVASASRAQPFVVSLSAVDALHSLVDPRAHGVDSPWLWTAPGSQEVVGAHMVLLLKQSPAVRQEFAAAWPVSQGL